MTTPDIHQLSERFNRCFETFDADDDLFADDAFFDLLPPLWRFQLQGSGGRSPSSYARSPRDR